jgi:hypothetical protein
VFLNKKQKGVLNKNRTMDTLQKHIFIRYLDEQTEIAMSLIVLVKILTFLGAKKKQFGRIIV